MLISANKGVMAFFCLGVFTSACAPQQAQSTPPERRKDLSENTGPVEAPQRAENILADRPLVVEGDWNGEKVRVLVDTGASGGSISAQLAERLGLEPEPGIKQRTAGSAGQWVESDVYRVDGLGLGGVAIEPFLAGEEPSSPRWDLVVGLPSIAGKIVDVDLERGEFRLLDDLPEGHPQMHALAVEDEPKTTLMASVRIGDAVFPRMIVDTGAGVSLIEEEHLGRFASQRLAEEVIAIDAIGVETVRYFVKVGELCVLAVCRADQTLMPDHVGTPGRAEVDGIVGMTFFLGSRFVLDLQEFRLGIEGGS